MEPKRVGQKQGAQATPNKKLRARREREKRASHVDALMRSGGVHGSAEKMQDMTGNRRDNDMITTTTGGDLAPNRHSRISLATREREKGKRKEKIIVAVHENEAAYRGQSRTMRFNRHNTASMHTCHALPCRSLLSLSFSGAMTHTRQNLIYLVSSSPLLISPTHHF